MIDFLLLFGVLGVVLGGCFWCFDALLGTPRHERVGKWIAVGGIALILIYVAFR